jgi:hypothetical protein
MLWPARALSVATRTTARCACPAAHHLQRAGVVDQQLDVARDRLLGADHAVDRKAFLAQQLAVAKLRRAQPRDGAGNAEHAVRHLAGHQVGGIVAGGGDEQVAVVGARAAQHRGQRAVAGHTAQLQALFQLAQVGWVGVDQGDVVGLGHQGLGHALAHAAGAENQDAHGRRTGLELTIIVVAVGD